MDVTDLLYYTLFLLILLRSCNGSGSISQMEEGIHSHSSPDVHLMKDQFFFGLDDLKLGNKIPIYFPRKDLSDSFARFLSKEETDSIPFSSEHFPDLLRFFSIPQGSPQASAMQATIKTCERELPKGVAAICATHMESMVDFAQTIFGPQTQLQLLATVHSLKSHTLLQNYTITRFNQIPTSKRVACHPMPYPYTIFSCHHHEDEELRVYKVWLTGEDGDKVDTIATCHMDTSKWKHDHPSFKLLGVEPGSIPICHFFIADNVVWVPKASIDAM